MLLLCSEVCTEVSSNAYCAKARGDTNDNVYCTAIIRKKEIKDFWEIMLIPVCSCIKKKSKQLLTIIQFCSVLELSQVVKYMVRGILFYPQDIQNLLAVPFLPHFRKCQL